MSSGSDEICFVTALPGIMDPSTSDNGSSSKNSANKEYTDPNGDLNIFIDGPYNAAETDFDSLRFKVFISKEDARNKCVVLDKTSAAASSDDESIDPTEVIIYYETDDSNADYENLYLRIKHQQLMLARGTYVVRVFKKVLEDANEEDDTTDGYEQIRVFTLTVRSNPIQGNCVNNKYLSTAFQGGNLINRGDGWNDYNKSCGCGSISVAKQLMALGYCKVSQELDEINGEQPNDQETNP